jgi:hypothetical protein
MTAARIDWDRVTPPLARYLTYVASYDERYAAWRSAASAEFGGKAA